MDYQKQIVSVLKASSWSQEELARRLGVSFATLNAWVNGRAKPRQKAGDAIRLLYFDVVGADDVDLNELVRQKQVATSLKTNTRAIVGDEAVLNKLTLHLTYHTNTIEGSTMTLADTEAVLFARKVLTNRTQVEQAEARNHQAALLWLLDEAGRKGFAIDEALVKGLHLRLMNGILSDAGQYRRHSVRIMGSRVAVANFQKVPTLMHILLRPADHGSEDLIAELASTHATFEKIHPFSDGNGRVGRLLMLAQALRAKRVPPIVLQEKKHAYYKYLELAQIKQEIAPLEYFITVSMLTTNKLLFED